MRSILYTRVSTDEQADRGFSLRDQEARLREFCAQTGRSVVAHFQDDESAKTFNRPEFVKLLALVRSRPTAVDEVLVVKWDRWSRDMTGALEMIRILEGLSVGVQAVEQPIDFEIPEQRMMLAVYLAAPEVENRRRSHNTIMGTRRALKEGRWCSRAPVGYRRDRDDRGKPIIVPSEKAELVHEAFDLVGSTDLPVSEIRLRMAKRGLRYSRSKFYDLLRRRLYTGYIEIPEWRNEPAEVVRGLHEPIIPVDLFERVQDRLVPRADRPKRQGTRGGVRQEFPLRGHLACPECSASSEPAVVTASLSRGRHGTRYAYYHCHKCGAFRTRAEEVHGAMPAFLRGLRLPSGAAELYRALVVDLAAGEVAERRRAITEAAAERERVEARLLRADEMFLDGQLENDSYRRLKAKLVGERDQTARLFETLSAGEADVLPVSMDDVLAACSLAEALPSVWANAEAGRDAQALHDLAGSIAPGKLTFSSGSVRTLGDRGLFGPAGPKTGDASPTSEPASPVVPRTGFEPVLPP